MKRTVDCPSYYEQFGCIADRCPDTCCAGWEIDLDEEAWYRYLVVTGPLGDKLRSHMKEEDGWKYFPLNEKGRCPFLLDSNLCELYQQLGEEALCTTCREHPRYFIDCGSYEQRDLSLGCPEVARIFFTVPAISYVRKQESGPEQEEGAGKPALLKEILSRRDQILSILLQEQRASKDSGHPAWRERMEQAGVLAGVDDTELLALAQGMEPLNEDWIRRVRALRRFLGEEPQKRAHTNGDTGGTELPSEEWKIRLSCYFVFRYWIDAYCESLDKDTGIADGSAEVPSYDFKPEIRLLNRSLRLMELLYVSDPAPAASGQEEIIRIAYIFSRQMEFDDDAVALMKQE